MGRATNSADIENTFVTTRNTERLMDAKRNMEDLKCSLTKCETVINAMWEVLQAHGISADELNAKIKEIVESDSMFKGYQNSMMPCPKCGKTIQESGTKPMTGRCLFCGEDVFFYPYVNND